MKFNEIGASVRRELDVGFIPYMKKVVELAETRHQNPLGMTTTFGSKDNSKFEVSAWAKAQIEEGDNVVSSLLNLVTVLDGVTLGTLMQAFPESFAQIPVAPDEFTYREVKTALNPQGDPSDW